ncbi:MAG TPA: ABC transporter permease, partial [Candidatus Limnocylindria bacterium]|nr:ABC transporter permease [Candidatus Limnocylindria bacterium]
MSLPPVVERELRVASRQPLTYWGRAGAGASGVAVICFIMAAHLAKAPLPIIGQIAFRILAFMTGATVMLSVLQLASAAFAREKREDTLGLLFLTPLRPIDMVVGKLVSTSLSAFYRFLAVV